MGLDKDMLLEQYRAANAHLVASDQKRDLALGLYVTLSAAVYGLNELLNGSNEWVFAVGVLIFVGFTLAGVFTIYRGWHGFYVIQAIAFQKVIHERRDKIDSDLIKSIEFKFNLLPSVELLMYVILLLTLFVHLSALLSVLPANSQWAVLVLLAMLFVVFGLHFYFMFVLDRMKDKGKLTSRYLWLLQGIMEER